MEIDCGRKLSLPLLMPGEEPGLAQFSSLVLPLGSDLAPCLAALGKPD